MILFFFSCFISDVRVLYGLFLVPIFAVLLFNSVVFVMVTVVLIKHTRKKLAKENKKRKDVTQGTIKAIISIVSVMVMFGLSWLFGALSISDGAVFFQWPFVIFNTLQGFILFLFSCVIGKDARDEWINLLTCNRRKKRQRKNTITNSRSHTGTSRFHKSNVHSTKLTNLSSRTPTLRTSELSSSTVYSEDTFSGFVKQNLASIAEETDLVTTDNSAVSKELTEEIKVDMSIRSTPELSTQEKIKHARKRNESVLPPHVLFRLNRPYYEVIVEDSTPLELSQETDFTQHVQSSDYDVFADLTSDSTVALIGEHA